MAPTATAEKEVTHQTTAGSLTGAGVVGGITGITTAAVGTKIAKNGLDFKSIFKAAKETGTNAIETVKENAQNINVGEKIGNIKENVSQAVEGTVENIRNVVTNNKNIEPIQLSLDLEGVTQGAKKAAEGKQGTVLNPTKLESAKETAKNFGDDIKGKAGDVLTGLQNNAKELKDGFKALPPGKQAIIGLTALLATLAVAKVTHDKLSEVHPEKDRIENVSTGVKKGQTTELTV